MNQVRRLNLLECGNIAPPRGGRRRRALGTKTHGLLTHSVFDDFFQPHKGPTADKQDIRGVHRGAFLVRVLAPALRRNVGHRAFQNLQQRLLHSLARNIAGDGRVFVLLGNLVDLVDVNDALLGALNIAAGALQELQNDIFNVLAHVPRFGQRSGIGNGKRHFQHARQGLRQQGLAGARRPDQQDIGFGQLHVAANARQNVAFVVVVDCHGKLLLGLILAHHILIEKRLDLRRARQLGLRRRHAVGAVFLQDAVAHRHALVTNVRSSVVTGRRNQLRYGILRLLAKGAVKQFLGTRAFQIHLRGLLMLVYDFIEDAVLVRLLGTHPEITFHVALNLFNRLIGMLSHDFVQAGTNA